MTKDLYKVVATQNRIDMGRIFKHCANNGYSPIDALSFAEYHRLQLGHDFGVQKRTPIEVLDDLAADPDKRRRMKAIGDASPNPALCRALLCMAIHPEYAKKIEDDYHSDIRPMLRGTSPSS